MSQVMSRTAQQMEPIPWDSTPCSTQTTPARASLRGRVVKGILHAIFTGQLIGGDRLVEEELGVKFGVSRTPVREGLSELAAIGVIRLKPNHGAMVCPFGQTQLREIYQVRRLLEAEATRLAAHHIDRIALADIRSRMTELLDADDRGPGWSEAALVQDQRLHELIARDSGSGRLAEEIQGYWTLARSIGEAVGNAAHTQDCALVEHMTIIEHLLNHRPDEAARAMAAHIDSRAAAALDSLSPRLQAAAPRAVVTHT
jgi:DNA-binding GntR family transcriptional regulator